MPQTVAVLWQLSRPYTMALIALHAVLLWCVLGADPQARSRRQRAWPRS